MPSSPASDPRLVPERADRLLGVMLDGEEVVYDPVRREAHLLNPTATVLLGRCDGRTRVDDLVDELHRTYGTDRTVIRADVEAALDDFVARQLVGSPPSPAELGDLASIGPGSVPLPGPVVPPATWTVVSPVLHALGSRLQVRSDEPLVGRYVDEVLGSLRSPPSGLPLDLAEAGGPVHTFDVVVGGPGPIRLVLDGSEVGAASSLAAAMSYLQWGINQLAAAGGGSLVVLHAAAVRDGDRVAVFPGVSNSGKSTLAAGLVEAGFGYLTDEAVAIDTGSGAVIAYPKPISLDRGAWPLFAHVEPRITGTDEPFFTDEWHVVPDALHRAALDPPPAGGTGPDRPRVTLVAFPTYRAGAPTGFEEVSRAEGLLMMLQSSFNMASVSASGLAALAQVTERAQILRLTVGDLAEAVHLIRATL